MGGGQSREQPEIPEVSLDLSLDEILKENTYYPETGAKYPYFLIQLSEKEELEYKGKLVSDAVVEYIRNNDITHIIAQTHGWNTPPNKAVAVPFTEFIGGMQNDAAMPQEDFNPVFVAFIWPAVPIEFARADDALTRTELLVQSEKENAGEDTDIARAATAARHAIEKEDPDDEEFDHELRALADASKNESDDEDDEDLDTKVRRLKDEATEEDDGTVLGDVVSGLTKKVINPLQNLVFGRLMARGQRTGKVMEKVLSKLMLANEGKRTKVCLMANSLGAHVLAGILNKPQTLPHKIHTVFFVQGAITRELFENGGKFEHVKDAVAGPIVCTHSARDLMLKNIYAFFHGSAVGLHGVAVGEATEMKSLDEARESPYQFCCGDWTSINGTKYIDEGNAVAGGHGDFKEDETTSAYWAAIKTVVDDSAYDR